MMPLLAVLFRPGRGRALSRPRLLRRPRLDAAGPRALLRHRDPLRLHERQLRGLLRLRLHAHEGRDVREPGGRPARDRRFGDGRPGPRVGLLRHEPRPALARRDDRLRRPGAAPAGHLREGPPLRRDRGEPGQGPPRGAAGVRDRPRGEGPRRGPRAGRDRLVPDRRPRAGLDPARAGERPRPAHAEERLHGAVRGGPRVRRARGEPGGGGGHDGEAARPLRRGRRPSPASATRHFSAQDQYLGGLLVFRKGARVAGVANVAAGGDPSALAKALLGRLP